jgi:uncharacterized membrane protein
VSEAPVSPRAITAFTVVLLSAHLVAALVVWPLLPEQVPVHLDLRGRPTRLADASLLVWLAPWLFSVLTLLFLVATVLVARRRPSLWNVPNRQSFLALPGHLRAMVEARIHTLICWIALLCALGFAGVHVGMYRAAQGQSGGAVFHLATLLPILTIIIISVRDSRAIARQIRMLAARAASER